MGLRCFGRSARCPLLRSSHTSVVSLLESAENGVNEPSQRVVAEGGQKKSRGRLRLLVEELRANGSKEIGQPTVSRPRVAQCQSWAEPDMRKPRRPGRAVESGVTRLARARSPSVDLCLGRGRGLYDVALTPRLLEAQTEPQRDGRPDQHPSQEAEDVVGVVRMHEAADRRPHEH
jgi:hypothetical protein